MVTHSWNEKAYNMTQKISSCKKQARYTNIATMIFLRSSILLLSTLSVATSFIQKPYYQRKGASVSTLFADRNDPSVDRMKQIIQEEASDANMMKTAAEQMKNLTPEQIDMMIRDMEQMNPIQKQALKALGMDPDAMKQTMKMMKGRNTHFFVCYSYSLPSFTDFEKIPLTICCVSIRQSTND